MSADFGALGVAGAVAAVLWPLHEALTPRVAAVLETEGNAARVLVVAALLLLLLALLALLAVALPRRRRGGGSVGSRMRPQNANAI